MKHDGESTRDYLQRAMDEALRPADPDNPYVDDDKHGALRQLGALRQIIVNAISYLDHDAKNVVPLSRFTADADVDPEDGSIWCEGCGARIVAEQDDATPRACTCGQGIEVHPSKHGEDCPQWDGD